MNRIYILIIDCIYALSVIFFEFINLYTRQMEDKVTETLVLRSFEAIRRP